MTWEVEGGFRMDRTWIYLWLIHVDVWQKPTQYPKAIILQLKVNKFKKIKQGRPLENSPGGQESQVSSDNLSRGNLLGD